MDAPRRGGFRGDGHGEGDDAPGGPGGSGGQAGGDAGDKDDIVDVTKKINGGTNGIADRRACLVIAKKMWADNYESDMVPVPVKQEKTMADSKQGMGAAAVVSNVSSVGEILTISSANSRIAGTVSIQAGLTQVAGAGTNFLSDLFIGQKIEVNKEFRTVATIADGVTLDVTAPFATNAINKKLGVFNRYPKGGVGYVQNNFPSITVSSNTGSGASVEVDSLASDNDRLEAAGVANLGAITKIRIVSPGAGFQFKPIISATTLGSGTAVLEAQIESSYLSTPGRWTTSDSILSSTERKLAGRNYYVDYSYINHYVLNGCVVLCSFNDSNDNLVKEIL
jgi:hypothetical protein